ncbi:hypothetical protein LJC61_06200 [Ruminococcaceae bacterium OttesenSCG-928-A16]|nr:hypothetical protein [Ruminococcaceae bacterium OttesenSCG-928-A16]
MEPSSPQKHKNRALPILAGIFVLVLLANTIIVPQVALSLQDKPLFGTLNPISHTITMPQSTEYYYAKALHREQDAYQGRSTTITELIGPAQNSAENNLVEATMLAQLAAMANAGVIPYEIADQYISQLNTRKYQYAYYDLGSGLYSVTAYFSDDMASSECNFVIDEKTQKTIGCSFWLNNLPIENNFDVYDYWNNYVQWLELGELNDWVFLSSDDTICSQYSGTLKLTINAYYDKGEYFSLYASKY